MVGTGSRFQLRVQTKAMVAFIVLAVTGIAAGTTVVVTSSVTVVRTWMMGVTPAVEAVTVFVFAAGIAWLVLCVLPLIAFRAILHAQSWGKWVFSGVAAIEVAILMVPTTLSPHWFASALVAATMCASAVVSWSLGAPTTPEVRSNRITVPGSLPRTARNSLVLMGVFGPLGIHSFYLRRAWQSVLTLSLCALGFVFSPWFPQYIFFGIGCTLLVVDVLRLDRLVDAANAR